jgi:hypothetical protein
VMCTPTIPRSVRREYFARASARSHGRAVAIQTARRRQQCDHLAPLAASDQEQR